MALQVTATAANAKALNYTNCYCKVYSERFQHQVVSQPNRHGCTLFASQADLRARVKGLVAALPELLSIIPSGRFTGQSTKSVGVTCIARLAVEGKWVGLFFGGCQLPKLI